MEESYPSRRQYKEEKEKKGKIKRTSGKLFIRTMMAFLICCTLVAGVFTYTAVAYVKDAPKLNPALLNSPQSSTIYDMNNKRVMDVAGEEYRKVVSLDQVPKKVQDAFLSVEDARFWQHHGIDVKRVAGALVANVREGFGVEGGSTITQQLVKMSFLSTEKTMKRKVQEAYLALKVERKYTKEEILEMYLNKVYFGEGAYGIATAAEVYFGKSVKDLSISEAALLAGLPQRPSGYNPFEYPDLAETRRETVLALMQEREYISEKEKKEAQSIPVEELLHTKKRKNTYNSFTDQVVRELGEKGISEEDLFTKGLKIYTTLDPKAQNITEKVLTTEDYIVYPDKEFKAGVVLLDTKTGEVRAIGGSRNTEEQNVQRGFNYATQLKRQPGSTAKPIIAYGPVIEKLKWSTNVQIKDEEIELNGKVFKNWDNRFHGNVSMRTALQWSYNIPAIKALQEAGYDEAMQFAENLGIELDEIFPAYAIGGFKDGVSPLQLAGAYAAFGNEGMYNEPHTVRKVVYPDGKEKNLQPKSIQAMSDYTAYMITDMLQTVVTEGTGQMANISGLPVAGKTGTNELPDHIYGAGVTDAWFAGYTTRYTASVWTGYDQTTQETFIQSKDADIAKLIFLNIMSNVSEGLETPDFPMPSTVEKVIIGNRNEVYVKGTAPKRNPVITNKPVKTNAVESKPLNKEEEAKESEKKEMEEKEKKQEKEKIEEKPKEQNEQKKKTDKDAGKEGPKNPDNNKPKNPSAEKPGQGSEKTPEDSKDPDGNKDGNAEGNTGDNDNGKPGNVGSSPTKGDSGSSDPKEKNDDSASKSPPPKKETVNKD